MQYPLTSKEKNKTKKLVIDDLSLVQPSIFLSFVYGYSSYKEKKRGIKEKISERKNGMVS